MDALYDLRLSGMADNLKRQLEDPNYDQLGFGDRLGLMVDAEILLRQQRRHSRSLSLAKLKENVRIEDLDFRANRDLDRSSILWLAESNWVRKNQNIIITGPTGIGKTHLSCALATSAISKNLTCRYYQFYKMMNELKISKNDGRWTKLTLPLSKVDLLIIDDFLIQPISNDEAMIVLEIIDDRYKKKSTIFTSQLPIDMWHGAIEDPTLADSILDRILESTHRIPLSGETMRHRNTTSQLQ
jgi:DNA replication protein DnaC